MTMPTLLELVEAGAHFGHNRSLTYPKAKNYVFTTKNGISLIDLEKTQNAILKAQAMLWQCIGDNRTVLFVGTKNSVRTIVQEAALSLNLPYITERWFGGTLTNFETIISNIKKMNDLEAYLEDDKSKSLSKKERLHQTNKLAHYRRFLGGLAALKKMPDLIVLASASADKVAITEASQIGISIIAICDTDVNPDRVTVPIPANDDAPKAVRLILQTMIEKPSTKIKAEPEAKEPKATVSKSKISDEPKKTVKKTEKAEPKKAVKKAVKKTEKAEKVEKPVKKVVKTKKAKK